MVCSRRAATVRPASTVRPEWESGVTVECVETDGTVSQIMCQTERGVLERAETAEKSLESRESRFLSTVLRSLMSGLL